MGEDWFRFYTGFRLGLSDQELDAVDRRFRSAPGAAAAFAWLKACDDAQPAKPIAVRRETLSDGGLMLVRLD